MTTAAAEIAACSNGRELEVRVFLAAVHCRLGDAGEALRARSGQSSGFGCIVPAMRDLWHFVRKATPVEEMLASTHSANTTRPTSPIRFRFVSIRVTPQSSSSFTIPREKSSVMPVIPADREFPFSRLRSACKYQGALQEHSIERQPARRNDLTFVWAKACHFVPRLASTRRSARY